MHFQLIHPALIGVAHPIMIHVVNVLYEISSQSVRTFDVAIASSENQEYHLN